MRALLRPAMYFLDTNRLVPSRPWPPHRVADGKRKGRCIARFRAGRVVGITIFEVGSWPFPWFAGSNPPAPLFPKFRREKDPLLPVNRCPTNP